MAQSKERDLKEKEDKTSSPNKDPEEKKKEDASAVEKDDLKKSEQPDAEGKDSEDKDTIDYKERYKKAEKERENYKKMGMKYKDKLKDRNEEVAEDLSEVINEKVKERMTDFQKDLRQDKVDEVIKAVSDNEDEQKLIRFHYDNTIKPGGFSQQAIQKDVKRAKLLANEPNYEQTISELSEALKSKYSLTSGSRGSNQDHPKAKKGKELSEDDKKFLKSRGKSEEEISNYRLINGRLVDLSKNK